MTDHPKLDWYVPRGEWDAFLEYVRGETAPIGTSVRREIEEAIREWIDRDALADLQDDVDELLRAAGRTPADLTENETSLSERSLEEQETTRVTYRVPEALRQAFVQFVEEHSENRLGVEFAKALRERRSGGRAERIQRQFGRIKDDVESILRTIAPGDEGLRKDSRKAKTIAMCRELNDPVPRAHLEAVIEEHAGPSVIEEYVPRILDRLELIEHPVRDDVYISEARIEASIEEMAAAVELPATRDDIHDIVAQEYEYRDDPALQLKAYDRFTPEIIDHIGARPHPNNDRLYLSPEAVEDLEREQSRAEIETITEAGPDAVVDRPAAPRPFDPTAAAARPEAGLVQEAVTDGGDSVNDNDTSSDEGVGT